MARMHEPILCRNEPLQALGSHAHIRTGGRGRGSGRGSGRGGGQVPMGVRTLLQLSNEKIDKVMEETAQVLLCGVA